MIWCMENGKKQYTLSAIIPCWNCAGEIGELMDCLLKQSFTDWIAGFPGFHDPFAIAVQFAYRTEHLEEGRNIS